MIEVLRYSFCDEMRERSSERILPDVLHTIQQCLPISGGHDITILPLFDILLHARVFGDYGGNAARQSFHRGVAKPVFEGGVDKDIRSLKRREGIPGRYRDAVVSV